MRIRWFAPAVVLGVGVLVAGCGQQSGAWHRPNFPTGNAVAGAQIFKSTCTTCHGTDALGVPGIAPALRGHAYLFTLYPTQAQLAAFIHDYMPRTNPGSLSKQQASDLAAFIYGINGKAGAGVQTQLLGLLPSSKPVKTPTGTALSAEIALGQKLYAKSCVVCHGANGQGSANSFHAPGLWPPAATASAVSSLGLSGLTSFIKQNMPLVPTNGVAPGSLSTADATALATFILSHK
jgi:cytochrome c